MPIINYETLNTSTDVTTTRTLLHEVIPLTGTIVSGTYKDGGGGSDYSPTNIKNYSHGMFQSVYDYPYLSSSANHIFDITMGYSSLSPLSASTSTQNSKKINMYNQMAQVLLGFSGSSGKAETFESDLNYADNTAENKMDSCYFLNFSRLIMKDQVKKGTFSMTVSTGAWGTAEPDSTAIGYPAFPDGAMITLTDVSASAIGGTAETQAGEYGVLYHTLNGTPIDDKQSGATGGGVGLVFYQAGVVVLSSSIWDSRATSGDGSGTFWKRPSGHGMPVQGITGAFTGSSMSGACDALRHRVANVSFNNTTEINSTIYFCRVPHNKYNYSANPSYISSSKIVVKSEATDSPISYITTIGLYNNSLELLAVAKLSEPLRKDPTNEITLRVRLDY
jgi:hypothetical protein